jgi:hypothetical protein
MSRKAYDGVDRPIRRYLSSPRVESAAAYAVQDDMSFNLSAFIQGRLVSLWIGEHLMLSRSLQDKRLRPPAALIHSRASIVETTPH